MPTYSQLARGAAWAMLIFIVGLMALVLVAAGFVALLITFLHAFATSDFGHILPERLPLPSTRVAAGIVAVVLLGSWLVCFYFRVAVGRPTAGVAKTGWAISSLAHLALTPVLAKYLPRPIEIDGRPAVSLAVLSGA